jgi:hypothetical protein
LATPEYLRQVANSAPMTLEPWRNSLRDAADEIDRLTRQLAET